MTTTLENIRQQISLLEDINNYKVKFLLNGHWGRVPASTILSDSSFTDELSGLNESQIQVVDIRDIDDEEQVSRMSIEVDSIENDSDLNQIYRSLVMLPLRGAPNSELTDRSGIFLTGSTITIPQDTHTTKSYSMIMDETAQSYANLNPVVMWSGGVDSTAILAAFVKNNIQFSVTIDSNTQEEAPVMYEYVRANFDCIALNNYDIGDGLSVFNMMKQKVTDRILVTGDCNDQIFPVLQHHLAIGKKFFKFHALAVGTDRINDFYKTPVDNSIKYMPARDYFVVNHSRIHACDVSQSQALYDSVIAPKLSQFPIATQYAYQLVSYFRFIFKYQMHLDYLNKLNTTNTLNNTFKAFYHTDDFQRWSITNFENNYETQSTTYLTMKTNVKQYSYDVFRMDEVLQQHKRASGLAIGSMPDSMTNNT